MTDKELEYNKNADAMQLATAKMKHRLDAIYLGGGQKKIDRQHDKGKMTARERVAFLLDDEDDFLEIGAFAGYEMYEEHGGCPAGGVITGIGRVRGRQCMIIANDATVKAGAWFPITSKKNLRAQEIAMENRLPLIYLVDSAGVFLPMQDEIFPDKEHFGRMFRNNAKISSMGISGIDRIKSQPPLKDDHPLEAFFPENPTKPYNTTEILKRIVDEGKLTFYKKDYGKTITCAYARIDGCQIHHEL